MAATGAYTILIREPGPNLISYEPAPKYSIRLRDRRSGNRSPIPVGPFGVNGGGDFPRHTDLFWNDEFTEAEFGDVLETYMDDPLFAGAGRQETAVDAFPACEVGVGTVSWAGQGHACRMLANFVPATPGHPLGPEESARGLGVLRRSTIYVPGDHSLKVYDSRWPDKRARYSPAPGVGVAVAGNGRRVGISANLVEPSFYPPTASGCTNFENGCFEPYTIEVPDENYSIDWRENESCPP